ncbi:MAG: hypothetical protein ACD_73C00169G0002, partial [uncultured bacterium]
KQRGREWKVTPANAARVLKSWIEYLKLDAQSKPDRLSVDLITEKTDDNGVIQNKLVLSNQDQLDLKISKQDNRHFIVTGLKKVVGSQGESEVRLDYVEHDTGKNKSFKVYRSSDESALFYLYDPEIKKYFNFVISSEGQLWVWERKALISKFLNPDSSVGFDMNLINPTLQKSNYANDAKSRATRVTVSEEIDPIKHFEVTAILGRWEGASDLDFTADKGGKLARLRFHVLVDETGKLELVLGAPNDMEAESGAYFPWDEKSQLEITEDESVDKDGVKHRGTVRVNVLNPEGKSEGGKDIEPYATVEFKNREALIGDNFEVAKAHYNKDGAKKKKIMPGERGYLCNRGGIVPAIGYFGVQDFLKLGEAGKAMLQSLVPTQALQSDYPLLMSALELLGGYVKADHTADEADVIEMAHFGNELTVDDWVTTEDEIESQPEDSEVAQPPGIGLLGLASPVVPGIAPNILPNGILKSF